MHHRTSIERTESRLTPDNKKLLTLLAKGEKYSKGNFKRSLEVSKEAFSLAKKANDSKAITDSLKLIGNAQFELGDITTSVNTFEKAIIICNDLHDELSKSIFQRLQSRSVEALGDFPLALRLLYESLDIQERISATSEMALTIYRQAKLCLVISDWKHGLESIERVLDILKLHPEPSIELSAYNLLGSIYCEIDEPEKALEAYLTQLKLCKKINPHFEAGALGSIGTLYHKLEKYDLALHNYQSSLKIAVECNKIDFIIAGYGNIGGIYAAMNNFDEALRYCDNALKLIETNYDHYKEQSALALKGSVLNSAGRFHEAIPILKKSLLLLERGGSLNDRYGILFEIFKAYDGLGKKSEALEFHKKYTEAKLEYIEKRSANDIRNLESRFLSERLKIEKQLLLDEIERRVREVALLGLEVLHKNDLLLSIKTEAVALYANADSPNDKRNLHHFIKRIESIVDTEKARKIFDESLSALQESFIPHLKNLCSTLTKMEIKICSLMKLNLNSHDIAGLLFTSERTIEWHRMNIRKKIGLKPNQEIQEVLDKL